MVEVQDIKDKEDLDLLQEGDNVFVVFPNFERRTLFVGEDNNGMHFLFRDRQRILDYAIPKDKLTPTHHGWVEVQEEVSPRALTDKDQDYELYDPLLRQNE